VIAKLSTTIVKLSTTGDMEDAEVKTYKTDLSCPPCPLWWRVWTEWSVTWR